jgi:hypothetical protein
MVQDFVRRKSREKRLKHRLHAIWFVPFRIYTCNLTSRFAAQVLHSDG